MAQVRKKDLCSAPTVQGAVPPTEENLVPLLVQDPENRDVLFSLGNVYLRLGNLSAAVDSFLKVLRADPEAAEVRCNLGMAYLLLEEFDDARSQFKKAILLRPELVVAHLHLARLELSQDRTEAAFNALEKLLRVDHENAEAFKLFAQVWEKKGDRGKAISYYEKAFALDQKNAYVRNRLGAFCFEEGHTHFQARQLDRAFQVWGSGYRKYARAFSAEKQIARAMGVLVKEFNAGGEVTRTLEDFETGLAQGLSGVDLYYPLFSRLYFSVGLQPELYTSRDSLEEEISRWEESMGQEIEYPFSHFRIGVLLTYQGRLEEALEKFSFCADHLPESKKRPLKLERVISFVKKVRDIEANKEDSVEGMFSGDDWDHYGFSDPFQQQAWKKVGISAAQAAEWKEAGFTAVQCQGWNKHKIPVGMAQIWLAAGFDDPAVVKRWIRGGFDPETARNWEENFSADIDKAVEWRKAGFEEPLAAVAWSKVFMFPWEAIRWLELDFTPRDSALWLAKGVKDPFIARQQKVEEDKLEAARKGESDVSDE